MSDQLGAHAGADGTESHGRAVVRAAFAAGSRMAHGGAVECVGLHCTHLHCCSVLLRSFAPMAGALPPNPEASSHGSRHRMWPRSGTGRDAA
jgi:hypothetical protein